MGYGFTDQVDCVVVRYYFNIGLESFTAFSHYELVGFLNLVVGYVLLFDIRTDPLPEDCRVNWVYITVFVRDWHFEPRERHAYHVLYWSLYVASHPIIGSDEYTDLISGPCVLIFHFSHIWDVIGLYDPFLSFNPYYHLLDLIPTGVVIWV